MNAKQFNAALETLKIDSHVRAAEVLGIGRTTVIRYAHGRCEVPVSMQRLLAMLIKHGIPKDFA